MSKLLEEVPSLHEKLNKEKKQEVLSPFFRELYSSKPTIGQIYRKRAADCEKVRNVDIGPFPGRNCRYLPLNDVKYIYGPCKFDYYKVNGRNFYIFGESHIEFGKFIMSPDIKEEDIHPATTLLFSSFIHSLVKDNKHKNYDLFIEDSFDIIHDLIRDPVLKDPTIKHTISDSLIHINSEFKNCIFKDLRTDCPYENLRVHSVDYREFPLGIVYWNSNFNNTKFKKYNEDASVNNTPKFINAYTTNYIKILLKLLETAKIKKQFERIEEPIKTQLYDFLKSKIEHIDKTIPFDDLRLQKLSSFIMDMYSLPRIFRSFDDTQKSHRQFKGQAENVIYYAGSAHTDTLKTFLHSIGIDPIQSIGADIDICQKPYMKIDKTFLAKFN